MDHCTPNFIPGPTGCEMPSEDETKSRRLAGGTLFRSTLPGTAANNIMIGGKFKVCVNGTTSCPLAGYALTDYNPAIHDECNVRAFELSIFFSGVLTWVIFVTQTKNCGSPITWNSGMAQLRSQLASAPTDFYKIVMPVLDEQTNGSGGTWNAGVDDADHLSPFSVLGLSGGSGISDSPTQAELDAIRTGPAFSLTNIRLSEKTTNDGSLVSINEVRYWNGTTWVGFDAVNPPVDCNG